MKKPPSSEGDEGGRVAASREFSRPARPEMNFENWESCGTARGVFFDDDDDDDDEDEDEDDDETERIRSMRSCARESFAV